MLYDYRLRCWVGFDVRRSNGIVLSAIFSLLSVSCILIACSQSGHHADAPSSYCFSLTTSYILLRQEKRLTLSRVRNKMTALANRSVCNIL